MKKGYILCFDSGIGGLTTLAHARHLLPREDFIYYADTAHAPYGSRPRTEVLELTRAAIAELRPLGIKTVLLACNAATSAGAATLRGEMELPLVGLEPAIKPALKAVNGKVVVLGTVLTVRGEKFHNLLESLPQHDRVQALGCPGLVELIEEDPEHKDIEPYLRELLHPYEKEMSALVLGCTHYIFLQPLFKRLWPDTPLFDGNDGISRRLAQILSLQGLGGGTGRLLMRCSEPGDEAQERFAAKCQRFYDHYEKNRVWPV
ncbi:MAG: glutamate racemase [Clostridiales bacterium]|nr:glutamate racemase [Clostridiales bacterium]